MAPPPRSPRNHRSLDQDRTREFAVTLTGQKIVRIFAEDNALVGEGAIGQSIQLSSYQASVRLDESTAGVQVTLDVYD
jgi:hypothetical protein